ncbi:hypothetical protein BGZ46_007323 [Entomortierella lignicola]|nr:hypothetical protein BGZ46_007323 [Entomortierella lignicola]
MTDNPYISLIQGLNSGDSPDSATAPSPTDLNDELSLWTNAEFTFDMPPGFGIFESDSGLDNIATTSSSSTNPLTHNDPILGQLQQPTTTASSLEYLNLPSQTDATEQRAVSLLERTRQRNPLEENSVSQPKLELQEQVAAINSFHSLLAAYSAASQSQQQQILQQQPQEYPSIQQPTVTNASTAAAPTTPAAAKLLRQPMPTFDKPVSIGKKSKAELPTSIITTMQLPSSQPQSPSKYNAAAKSNRTAFDENNQEEKDDYEESEYSVTGQDDAENQNKLTPQEDKRRRNTAASARFRQKKKLREQALEQTAQEQTARAEALEARVKELEMEVRWLRGLIVEKDSRLHEATVSLADSNKRIRLESS